MSVRVRIVPSRKWAGKKEVVSLAFDSDDTGKATLLVSLVGVRASHSPPHGFAYRIDAVEQDPCDNSGTSIIVRLGSGKRDSGYVLP